MSNSNSGKKSFFTSESVSEGHPDKLCDQISDAILDECLKRDKDSHVACETFATTDFVLVGGEINMAKSAEITSDAVEKIARKVASEIGYNDKKVGLDSKTFEFMNKLHKQSSDIYQGVAGDGLEEFKGMQGAGDQGIMFGFACDETPELLGAPIVAANAVLKYAAKLRHEGKIPWLRPDAKSQITVEYEGYTPKRIHTVVLSHQHDENVDNEEIRSVLIEKIIKPTLKDTNLLDDKTVFFINPTGRFVIGGPDGDAGLTGRKIIVDTYGGSGRHGGGAFSGKDPSKVDRSASYMARYIAKNIVAAKLAGRAEVQLSYAIGVPFPISVRVDTFGTEKVDEEKLEDAVKKVFDLTPRGIIETLDLKRPIYQKTASYGHFGRDEFSWEKCDKIEELLRAL